MVSRLGLTFVDVRLEVLFLKGGVSGEVGSGVDSD